MNIYFQFLKGSYSVRQRPENWSSVLYHTFPYLSKENEVSFYLHAAYFWYCLYSMPFFIWDFQRVFDVAAGGIEDIGTSSIESTGS